MGHCAVIHDPYQQNLFLCNHMNKNQRRKKISVNPFEWFQSQPETVLLADIRWISGKSQTGQLDIKLKSKLVF